MNELRRWYSSPFADDESIVVEKTAFNINNEPTNTAFPTISCNRMQNVSQH